MTRQQMRYATVVGFLWMLVLVPGADCSNGFFPTGGLDDATGARVILLRIVNESGVAAEVNASFFVGENEVRTTMRQLAAAGAEATEIVVPTRTDLIHLVARETGPINAAARVGDVLATVDIEVGPDVLPGDILTYTLRPPGWQDCNANETDDAEDISNETSLDCNSNGIPDECDIASGYSEDCNVNGTPDECESTQSVTVVFAEADRVSATDQDGVTPSLLIDLFNASLGTCGKVAPDPANGHLYFTAKGASAGDDTLMRVALSGGAATPLVSSLDNIEGVALDVPSGKIYWSAYISVPAGAYIGVANLDGLNPTTVLGSLSGSLQQVFVDAAAAKLYFAQNLSAGADLIQSADLDGSNVASVLPNLLDPRDVDLFPAADLIVWADHGIGGGVFTSRLDGGGITRIADVPSVTGVAIDRANCRIYWCGIGSGANTGFIERADLDGGNRQTILSGLDAPVDVAVYRD